MSELWTHTTSLGKVCPARAMHTTFVLIILTTTPVLGLGLGLGFAIVDWGCSLGCGTEVELQLEVELKLELELEPQLELEPKLAFGSNNPTRVRCPLAASIFADELHSELVCQGLHVSEHAALHIPKGPQKFVDCESISPTQGATQFADCLVWIWGGAKQGWGSAK